MHGNDIIQMFLQNKDRFIGKVFEHSMDLEDTIRFHGVIDAIEENPESPGGFILRLIEGDFTSRFHPTPLIRCDDAKLLIEVEEINEEKSSIDISRGELYLEYQSEVIGRVNHTVTRIYSLQ